MNKKVLKIIGGIVLVVVLLLIATPFFLKGKIADIIKNKVNSSINASFDFADADLTLFTSFPYAKVTMNDITLINKAPFEGDTLFAAKEVALNMSIKELLKDASEPIIVKTLKVDGGKLDVKVDKEGNANYDIALIDGEDEVVANDASQSGFTLSLESYEIMDAMVRYGDASSGIYLTVDEMDHKGKGDLSMDTSELDTETSARVSFVMDSTNYLNRNPVKLKALIGVDLNENKYTFLKNEALVNQLALVFEGFVKLNEDNQEVDITFKTPSSDFKNFLAVIPETYSKNIENVTTTGNFTVAGEFKGIVDDTHIPKFKIDINSDNASFQYPDLPKSVRNVFIDTEIANTTGIVEDTYVDIRRLSFMIDEDKFNMVANIRDLMGNTKVKAQIDGRMNLANISQAYPVPSGLDLKGMLNADISTAFDMASIERKAYENTNTKGTLQLRDFEYRSDEIPNPVILQSTAVTFNPTTVSLNELKGSTGNTDFDATGTINNLLGFMFNNEKVEGRFNLSSNTFSIADFMVADTEEVSKDGEKASSGPAAAPTEKIKIPSFLDCVINASANTVVYDNLRLRDLKGTLIIKDEKATLSNMTSSIFNGKLALNGEVSTKTDTPTFAMNLGMDNFSIAETFKELELFRTLAPIAKVLHGTLNSDIRISGNLMDDLTPDLGTVSGNILAELMTSKIDAKEAPLLSALDSKLNFLDLEKLDLKDLKTTLTFENGVVKVKPFTIKYQDFAIDVAGSHSFDQALNYMATIQVPAKYLGKEVAQLMSRIDESSLEQLTVPVTANIGGAYTNPTVTTDLTSGIKNITAQLVEIEKQKLINTGKDKAKDIIGDILAKNQKTTDSTKKENSEKVKDVLGGLFGGTAKKTDSTAKKDSVGTPKEDAQKDAAKKILGGIFGKKKQEEPAKQDSVN